MHAFCKTATVADASGWRRNTGGQESTRDDVEEEEEDEEEDGQLDDTEWPGRSRIPEMSEQRASGESRIGDRVSLSRPTPKNIFTLGYSKLDT